MPQYGSLGASRVRGCIARLLQALAVADDDRVLEWRFVHGWRVVTFNRADFRGAERFGVQIITPRRIVEARRLHPILQVCSLLKRAVARISGAGGVMHCI